MIIRDGTRQGSALLAAIAVLAILTILVGGLAASQSQARNNSLRAQLKRDLQNVARVCVDTALARLETGEPVPFDGKITVDVGSQLAGVRGPMAHGAYAAKAAPGDATCYEQSNFLSPRAGDALLEVTVRGRRSRQVWQLRQLYLVNAGEASARRVRLSQRLVEGIEEEGRP